MAVQQETLLYSHFCLCEGEGHVAEECIGPSGGDPGGDRGGDREHRSAHPPSRRRGRAAGPESELVDLPFRGRRKRCRPGLRTCGGRTHLSTAPTHSPPGGSRPGTGLSDVVRWYMPSGSTRSWKIWIDGWSAGLFDDEVRSTFAALDPRMEDDPVRAHRRRPRSRGVPVRPRSRPRRRVFGSRGRGQRHTRILAYLDGARGPTHHQPRNGVSCDLVGLGRRIRLARTGLSPELVIAPFLTALCPVVAETRCPEPY